MTTDAPVSRAIQTQLTMFTGTYLNEKWGRTPLDTHDQYRRAVGALALIRSIRLDLEDSFREIKRAANATRKSVLEQEKKWINKARPLEEVLNDLIVAYDHQRAAVAQADARAALETPATTALVAYSELATEPEGYHTRRTVVPVVSDKLALVQAVANGEVDLEARTVNLSYLRTTAQEQGDLCDLPGVTVTHKYTVVTHKETTRAK